MFCTNWYQTLCYAMLCYAMLCYHSVYIYIYIYIYPFLVSIIINNLALVTAYLAWLARRTMPLFKHDNYNPEVILYIRTYTNIINVR